jgi:hypothetical protein
VSERASGVTVSGTGRIPVRPDLLLARLGVEVVAGSVQDALDRSSGAVAAMARALREWGIADADLGTAGASVYAAHDPQGNQRGWTATQQLTAKLRSLDTAGEQVAKALAAAGDAARLHELTFEVADDTAPRAEARRLAFADASAKAALYAGLAGRELGPVRAVAEGGPGDVPLRGYDGAMMSRAAQSMPVEAGSLDITVVVTVQWDFVG